MLRKSILRKKVHKFKSTIGQPLPLLMSTTFRKTTTRTCQCLLPFQNFRSDVISLCQKLGEENNYILFSGEMRRRRTTF